MAVYVIFGYWLDPMCVIKSVCCLESSQSVSIFECVALVICTIRSCVALPVHYSLVKELKFLYKYTGSGVPSGSSHIHVYIS